MNNRLLAILVCALAASAAASYVVYRMIASQMNSRTQSASLTRIVVAGRNIDLGVVLTANDVKTAEWAGALPAGVVTKPETAIGRGVVTALNEGEPIFESRLAAVGSGGGLAATIPPGMRACAVRVNEVVGVAGFVVPGMRVDVLVGGTPPGSNTAAGMRVKTILQNIRVLSAGANIQKDNEGKPVQVQVVNLLVTPDQAETLSLASGDQTRIQLVLRNPLDTQVAKTSGSVMANLFADSNAPPPVAEQRRAPRPTPKPTPVAPIPAPQPPAVAVLEKPAPPRIYLIEVLNGAKRTESKFPEETK